MQEQGLVPVFYHHDLSIAKKVLKACYKGGVRTFEFTNRGDFAHELFAELNKYALKELPDMILGVGSVIDAGTASVYLQLGANFIVTPVLREEIASVCNRRKVLWSPGCYSPTEISRAEELGAEIIKIFPASQLGPDFVKAVKGPSPWTSIMPTGGITTSKEDLHQWFDAGVTCVGIGSALVPEHFLEDQNYEGLQSHVRDTLTRIKNFKDLA